MKTAFPVGTSPCQPDRCAIGYTLVFGDATYLIDMHGRVARSWVLGRAINSVGTDR
jgi:hypothetical protein